MGIKIGLLESSLCFKLTLSTLSTILGTPGTSLVPYQSWTHSSSNELQESRDSFPLNVSHKQDNCCWSIELARWVLLSFKRSTSTKILFVWKKNLQYSRINRPFRKTSTLSSISETSVKCCDCDVRKCWWHWLLNGFWIFLHVVQKCRK